MTKIIVKTYEETIVINKEYVWELDKELNDNKNDFIKIEGYIFKKTDIIYVKTENLENK